jgi:hypothetical protein
MINKLDLRESLQIPVLETSTSEEAFQNRTLRPILKLQNELYLSLFTNYAIRQNADFNSFIYGEKSNFIEQSLQKNNVLRSIFIGITIGMFTLQELEVYNFDSKFFNKRIITMLTERLKNQIK